MQFNKHINKYLLRLCGVVVLLCIAVAVTFNFSDTRSLYADGAFSFDKASNAPTSFKTASSVHRSVATHTSHCHFSLRNKNTVRLLLAKGPYEIYTSFLPYFAKVTVAGISANYSEVSRPGYYLFLFRYALF